MNKFLAAAGALAFIPLAMAQPASAPDAAAPKSRSEVKAETRAAVKSGQLEQPESGARYGNAMGAGRFTVLRRVTLPLLTPSIVGGGMFAFLISFDEVVISWFVSRAGYTTLPVKMFSSLQFEVSPVLAAISTLLTALSVAVCIVVARVQRGSPS